MNSEPVNDLNAGVFVPPPHYRALKAIVIILGVLIVVSLGALVTAVALGLGPKNSSLNAQPYHIVLPAGTGARIVDTVTLNNRLAVRVEDDKGGHVVIVDPAGRVVGTIAVGAAP